MLDIGRYREQRREELIRVGQKAVSEVSSFGKPVKLAPMSPFERKIIHDTVATAGLSSESDGEEPHRYVVVRPSH